MLRLFNWDSTRLHFLNRVGVPLAMMITLGCAATQPVRVLHSGERRWIASVGGPLQPHHVPQGVLPYTNIGTMWGHSEATTLSANLHVLAAAFGIAGVDVGAARRMRTQRGAIPEVTAQSQLYLFAGSGGARVYPNFTGTASWSAGQRTLLYGGSALTVRPSGGKALVASPLTGIQRDVGRRLVLQLEGKWMAANIDMNRGLFEGENTIGGNGGLAMQLGLQLRR